MAVCLSGWPWACWEAVTGAEVPLAASQAVVAAEAEAGREYELHELRRITRK